MKKSTTNCFAHDEKDENLKNDNQIKKRSYNLRYHWDFFSNQHKRTAGKKTIPMTTQILHTWFIFAEQSISWFVFRKWKNAIQIRFIDVDWNPVASVWTINIEVA